MIVFAIPRLEDLVRFDPAAETPLGAAMQEFAEADGYEFLDLLPVMHERYEGSWNELFLPCDDHGSPLGHEAAAAILLEALYGTGPA